MTSPAGQLDAVLVRKGYGGAAGGFEWYLSIVPKGSAAIEKTVVFQAGKMSGEKLVWKQPNLIELSYDVALIEHFRNLWGLHEIQDAGAEGQRDYRVEIRLAPSNQDYSVLTPAGGFR